MPLWKRQYRVTFPDIKWEYANTLRIEFSVTKDLTQETNKSDLKIYNLSDASRKKIEVADLKLELYAGYEKNGGPMKLFTGSVIQAFSKDENSDVVTELRLSDGQTVIRDSVFSLSYAPGTSSKVIIDKIAAEMGMPVIYGEKTTFTSFEHGYSFVGKGADALSEVCGASGLSWSIQNDMLQVILAGGTVTSKGIVFSPSSGLIGSPERIIKSNPKADKETPKRKRKQKSGKEKPEKQAGWRIRALLAPTINPGDAVKVESRVITGWFRVESVHHSGDSHGGDWITELTLIERLTYETNS